MSSIVAGFLAAAASGSSAPANEGKDPIEVVRAVLQAPEDSVDLATAKLTFDKLIDPAIDVGAGVAQINRMAEAIRAMAGLSASSRQKLSAVRDYIYVAGPWNNHRPYQYDLDDPFGEKITNKLLPNYISSRRGNCVTMPFLFIILADRMGLPATASTAPNHIFVKATDETTGKTFNLEATSGAHVTRDVWYRQKMPMTDAAIANGVYMKALTRRETLAVMASTVLEHYRATNQHERAIGVANAMVAAYPSYADAMVHRGSVFADLLEENFYRKYPMPADVPLGLRREYSALVEENRSAFEKAEALGWRAAEELEQVFQYGQEVGSAK